MITPLQMQNKRFSIHGSLDLWVEGDMLMLEGTGPWNLESVNQSDEQAIQLKSSLYGKQWGAILRVFGDPIYVPEAAHIIVESVKEDIENGRLGTAILVNECNSPEFGRRHLSQLYDEAGEVYKFFDDIVSARAWVRAIIES